MTTAPDGDEKDEELHGLQGYHVAMKSLDLPEGI